MGPTEPKIITYDAHIYIGENDEGETISLKAILHYLIPDDEPDPADDAVFFVFGTLSMVNDETTVGRGFNRSDYAMQIEAISVCLF
jgi:hypothetical protein